MTPKTTWTFALLIGAICSLGCLIPSPDLFPDPEPDPTMEPTPDKQGKPDLTVTNNKNTGDPKDPDPKNNEPPYDPSTHDTRDNPNSGDYRGQFTANIDYDDTQMTLDGLRLGEATYAFFDFDGLVEDPHCLISLIDQRADTSGRLGYILFKLPIENCSQNGSFTLSIADDEGNAPRNTALIKAIQIEQEDDNGVSFTVLRDVKGSLVINDISSRRMKATFNISASTALRDDREPQRVDATVAGEFEAVLLNQ